MREGDLGDVRGLDVRLGAVRDAVLQHLLHPGHQEDVCVGVSHREDGLREFNSLDQRSRGHTGLRRTKQEVRKKKWLRHEMHLRLRFLP